MDDGIRPSLPAVPASWEPIGETVNARYFMATPDVMIVYPHPGSKDDGRSARENVALQMGHAEKLGRPLGFVVVMTSLTSQNAEARKVYAEGMRDELSFGAALVAESLLARAIASFFLGLSKPKMPTRVVDSIDTGIKWLTGLRAQRGPA